MIRTDALAKRAHQEILARAEMLKYVEAGATVSIMLVTDAAGLVKRVIFRIEETSAHSAK